MDKTLKTYEDGSELTVGTLLIVVPALLIIGGVSAYVTVKVSNWRTDRWLKKNGHYNYQWDHKK